MFTVKGRMYFPLWDKKVLPVYLFIYPLCSAHREGTVLSVSTSVLMLGGYINISNISVKALPICLYDNRYYAEWTVLRYTSQSPQCKALS